MMPTYNIIECNTNHAITTESFWKYCRDKPDDNDIID